MECDVLYHSPFWLSDDVLADEQSPPTPQASPQANKTMHNQLIAANQLGPSPGIHQRLHCRCPLDAMHAKEKRFHNDPKSQMCQFQTSCKPQVLIKITKLPEHAQTDATEQQSTTLPWSLGSLCSFVATAKFRDCLSFEQSLLAQQSHWLFCFLPNPPRKPTWTHNALWHVGTSWRWCPSCQTALEGRNVIWTNKKWETKDCTKKKMPPVSLLNQIRFKMIKIDNHDKEDKPG